VQQFDPSCCLQNSEALPLPHVIVQPRGRISARRDSGRVDTDGVDTQQPRDPAESASETVGFEQEMVEILAMGDAMVIAEVGGSFASLVLHHARAASTLPDDPAPSTLLRPAEPWLPRELLGRVRQPHGAHIVPGGAATITNCPHHAPISRRLRA
jgi:hypothetical protein